MALTRFQRFAQTSHGTSVQDEVHRPSRPWTDHVLTGLGALGATVVLALGTGWTSTAWAAPSTPGWQAAYEEQAQTVLQRSVQAGWLDEAPQVRITSPQGGESDALVLPGVTCRIEWQLDPQGRAESLDPSVSGPAAMVDGVLYRKAALLHEASHCQLGKVSHPLRATGLPPAAENWLNQWVIGQPSSVSNPFSAQFSESGADCYGLIQLLAQEQFSPEAIAEVHRWHDDRQKARQMLERAGAPWHADPHMTDFALQHLLDNLDTVRHADPSTYEDLALRFASQGFMDWIRPSRPVMTPNGGTSTFGPEALEALVSGFDTGDWFGMDVGYQVTVLRAEAQGTLPVATGLPSESRAMAQDFMTTAHPLDGLPQAQVVRDAHGLSWKNMSDTDLERFDESLRGTTLSDTVDAWKTAHGWTGVRTALYNGMAPGYLKATQDAQQRHQQAMASVLAEAQALASLDAPTDRVPRRANLVSKTNAPAPSPTINPTPRRGVRP